MSKLMKRHETVQRGATHGIGHHPGGTSPSGAQKKILLLPDKQALHLARLLAIIFARACVAAG